MAGFFSELVTWISGARSPVTPPSEAATDGGGGREKRRFVRVNLQGAHLYLGKNGPFAILNLSFGGLRAMIPPPHRPQPDTVVHAQMVLPPSRFTTRLAVKNNHGNEVGLAFLELGPKESRLLADHLRPLLIGGSLHEITGLELQSPDPRLKLRWFQGENDTQLFVWQSLDANQVVKEEFYFCNYVMVHDREQDTLRVGKVEEGAPKKAGSGRIDPDSAVFFGTPPFQALRLGQAILDSSSLPAGMRDGLLAGIAREERRLFRRYLLKDDEARVGFVPAEMPTARWQVVNLSLTGIALLVEGGLPADGRDWSQRDVVAGHLVLGDKRIPAQIWPRYWQGDLVGGRLQIEMQEGAEHLAEFLAPRLLGQLLEEDPRPGDELFPARPGARPYLYVGVHNTHLLALVGPGAALLEGRLVVLDQLLTFARGKLKAYVNHGPMLMAIERELPLGQLVEQPLKPYLRYLARELIASAPAVADEVRTAWLKALDTVPRRR